MTSPFLCAKNWQLRRKIPLVGMLQSGSSPGSSGSAHCTDFFRQGLRDLGYVEGQNIALEYRYADNQFDRLPALAAELVRLTPEVIWTHSNAAALAAKQAITTIPVVIGVSQDLMELGVVESLARPGGNLTGLDLRVFALMGKRLELLKDAVPTLARVAVLVNPTDPLYKEVPHNMEREARALGVQLQRVEASGPGDLRGGLCRHDPGGGRRGHAPGGPAIWHAHAAAPGAGAPAPAADHV
jgi:putative tryptophan/tyrosine transport system substrate-binding protein